MAQLTSVIASTLFCSMLFVSCADVPVEFKLDRRLELKEKDVKDTTQKIFNKLSKIVKQPECAEPYKKWLKKQFEDGYVPKRVVKPSEYAKSISIPLTKKCSDVDFSVEFELASEQIASKTRGEIILFPLKESKDSLPPGKCFANFIDPAKDKLEVLALDIKVEKNTLNVSALSYTIYTSDKEVTAPMLRNNTEQDLVNNGTLKKLADTEPIPPGHDFKLPVKLPVDRSHDESITPLISLEGSIVAYPKLFKGQPETIERSGQTYYVVPEGGLLAFAEITYSLKTSLFDAKCLYDDYLEKIKEHERERREEEGE